MLLNDSMESGIDVLNEKDVNGYTVLQMLCRQRNYNFSAGVSARKDNAVICDWLIKKGAEVNAVNKENKMALYLASDCSIPNEVYSLVKVLVDNGADVMLKDESGKTALDLFVSNAEGYHSKDEYYPLDNW